jgi:hypothetical protein
MLRPCSASAGLPPRPERRRSSSSASTSVRRCGSIAACLSACTHWGCRAHRRRLRRWREPRVPVDFVFDLPAKPRGGIVVRMVGRGCTQTGCVRSSGKKATDDQRLWPRDRANLLSPWFGNNTTLCANRAARNTSQRCCGTSCFRTPEALGGNNARADTDRTDAPVEDRALRSAGGSPTPCLISRKAPP